MFYRYSLYLLTFRIHNEQVRRNKISCFPSCSECIIDKCTQVRRKLEKETSYLNMYRLTVYTLIIIYMYCTCVFAEIIGETPVKRNKVLCRGCGKTPRYNNPIATDQWFSETIVYTPGVVSLPEVIRGPVNDILREPLWKVKAKPQSKHTYLSSCLRDNTYPKGVTPKVPLKIIKNFL